MNFYDKNEDDQVIDEVDFIDDNEHGEGVIFYRIVDKNNINKFSKFPNQTRDLRLAVYEDSKMFSGVDNT